MKGLNRITTFEILVKAFLVLLFVFTVSVAILTLWGLWELIGFIQDLTLR